MATKRALVRRRAGSWPRQTVRVKWWSGCEDYGYIYKLNTTHIGVRIVRRRRARFVRGDYAVIRWPFARVRHTEREKARTYKPRRWACECCGWMSGGGLCRVGDVCSDCFDARVEPWSSEPAADVCPTCGWELMSDGRHGVYCEVCDIGVFRGENDTVDTNPALTNVIPGDAVHMGMVAVLRTLEDVHMEQSQVLYELHRRATTETERRYFLDASIRQAGLLEGLKLARGVIDSFVLPE